MHISKFNYEVEKKMSLGVAKMKVLRVLIVLTMFSFLSNCGTFGGAVRGLGSDLDIVGSYITDF